MEIFWRLSKDFMGEVKLIYRSWRRLGGSVWTLRPGWEAIAREIPATLRELVMQRQAQRSPTEQRLLEVASVAGLEGAAASIAAGLAAEVLETETWCEELA